jgi:hypothetical protein
MENPSSVRIATILFGPHAYNSLSVARATELGR